MKTTLSLILIAGLANGIYAQAAQVKPAKQFSLPAGEIQVQDLIDRCAGHLGRRRQPPALATEPAAARSRGDPRRGTVRQRQAESRARWPGLRGLHVPGRLRADLHLCHRRRTETVAAQHLPLHCAHHPRPLPDHARLPRSRQPDAEANDYHHAPAIAGPVQQRLHAAPGALLRRAHRG